MTPFKAVIFDCDGTLILSGDLHFAALSDACAAQGAALSRDWYDARAGLARDALLAEMGKTQGDGLDRARLVRDSIAQTIARAAEAAPNPAVARLARSLSGLLPMAVATNSEGAVAHALLRATGLSGLFDAVVTVDQVARPKPAPDLFLEAAARLGTAPGDCLVLEDSDEGLRAARHAGMLALDVRGPSQAALRPAAAMA